MNLTPRHILNPLCITIIAHALTACSDTESTSFTGLGRVAFEVEANTNPLAPPADPFSLTMTSADEAYSHTWSNVNQFPILENFYTGAYTALSVSGTLGAEGYDCPCYSGEAAFEIFDKSHTSVVIPCHLTQALAEISVGAGLNGIYPSTAISLHTSGHGYVAYEPEREGPMLVMPGRTSAVLTFTGPDGEQVSVMPDFEMPTTANELSRISVDMDADSVLTLACGEAKARMRISHSLFATEAPTIEASGFTPGEALDLVEGFPASSPVVMTLNAPAGIQAATLTAICSLPSLEGMPAESDLWSDPGALAHYGLKVSSVSDRQMIIDFTNLLENVAVEANSGATFLVVCRDVYGRVSATMVLKVDFRSLDMSIVSSTPAIVGVDTPSITLALNTAKAQPSDFAVHITDEHGTPVKDAPIIGSQIDSLTREITLQFKVDEGSDNIPVCIDFMGTPKLNTLIVRDIEPYNIIVDAFATAAIVYFQAETPEMTSAIVRLASVKVNGKEASINSRYEEEGAIRIVGLEPSTTYTVSPVVVANGFAPEISATTEDAASVPSGDFEDPKSSLKYEDMKSGGQYSVSPFPVFSHQNFTTIDTKWVEKHWANVNAKTFCTKASNHNTWYLQPSGWLDYDNSASGSKSACIASVGWSLDGPEIPPYSQEPGGEYLPYNANVPHIDHRSAGKLFLGSYHFNPATMQEQYTEGVSFRSRPSSLNGFFKYIPDATVINDYGTLVIELLNENGPEPAVVASATVRFNNSPDFIAFNVPLEYKYAGVKATRLKMMFSSSHTGGTIDEEDAYVPVTSDPEHARSIGSVLWIDNLSFSYSY